MGEDEGMRWMCAGITSVAHPSTLTSRGNNSHGTMLNFIENLDKNKNDLSFSDVDDDESENEDNGNNEWEDDEENPLDMDIIDASTKSAKAKTVADVWIEQDIFKQTLQDDNDDEEFELERKLNALKSDGIPILGKN